MQNTVSPKRTNYIPFLIALLWLLPQAAFGQSPEQILSGARLMGNADSVVFGLKMEISTARGTKSREMEIYSRDDQSGLKVLAQITAPAFLTNMKFLTVRDGSGKEAKWMKTSRGVRRLSDANYGDTLFDSDFTVEDLSRIEPRDYTLSLLASENDLIRIRAIPVKTRREYAEKRFFIDPQSRIVQSLLFLDETGQTVKEYRLLDTQTVEDTLFPLRCSMTNLKKNTSTILEFLSVENNADIPDRMFSRAGL